MFDRIKAVSAIGTVAKIEWVNPHIFIWAYVPKSSGGYEPAVFESASINELRRQGWTRDTLKVGEKITIEYWPLKDGRAGGYFLTATHEDGTKTVGNLPSLGKSSAANSELSDANGAVP
jgi:hypothetical protein